MIIAFTVFRCYEIFDVGLLRYVEPLEPLTTCRLEKG